MPMDPPPPKPTGGDMFFGGQSPSFWTPEEIARLQGQPPKPFVPNRITHTGEHPLSWMTPIDPPMMRTPRPRWWITHLVCWGLGLPIAVALAWGGFLRWAFLPP